MRPAQVQAEIETAKCKGGQGSRHFSEEALQSMRLEGFLHYSAAYSPTGLIMLYKQFFYVHGQEILCADAAITDYQCRIRLKIFPECVKPVCAFFRITLHFNRNDAPFFAKYEIDLVISVTPIEHLKTVDKGLADQPSANRRSPG